jgi:hypothetical protein
MAVGRRRRGVEALWTLMLAAAMGVIAGRAQAQWTVFDPSVFGQTVQQVSQGATQIANQVTSLRKLASPSYRELSGTFGTLGGDFSGGRGIVYGAADPAGALATTYPGAQPSAQYRTERATQVSQSIGTAAAVLEAAQVQARTFAAGWQQLADMRAQMAGIHGHQEALEQANTIAVFEAGELLLLRQATEAANNLQAVEVAQRATAVAQPEANAHVLYWAMATQPTPRALISFRP